MYSSMASSAGNRARFIAGLKQFMATYGFDGVDLEYPQVDDLRGADGDKVNCVSLIKEMKATFGTRYGISVTLPTSYWCLQHFDLPGIYDSIDWFNLMSYDNSGFKFIGPLVPPHTNITEIEGGLDLLGRAGVAPSKVVLGQGWTCCASFLSAVGTSIPIIGEIADIAEIVATPAIIELCVKGVEKEGKAEFKVFGKEHTLDINKPTDKPSATRLKESSHSTASTKTACSKKPQADMAAREIDADDDDCLDAQKKMTTETADHAGIGPDFNGEFLCMWATERQACMHYRSMHSVHPDSHYNSITCPYYWVDAKGRPVVAEYNKGRKAAGWFARSHLEAQIAKETNGLQHCSTRSTMAENS
ncbi:glycoside hydrolase [Mollisia scopiformis]|uniref:Glycoside hydrolase n=1 Tax=Mollisia scopiformis TaxID=149040 RepID=A0A132BC08_MOLSC|nr:glycoside hydrolase [Mollisia scopiformis]KUJ09803.1 glycoside hydrolase [Mollisia scopiformis]